MSFNVEFNERTLVFSAPVNDATKKWGVYCLPRLWRLPTGRLVVRINGEADSADPDTRNTAPTVYAISDDEGKTWMIDPDGAEKYDMNVLQGNSPAYRRLSDGRWIAIRNKENRKPIVGVSPVKEFMFPNEGFYWGAFPAKFIPEECMGFDLVEFDCDGNEISRQTSNLDFPDRELLLDTKAWDGGDGFKDIPVYVKSWIWYNTYISCLTELPDGTLCGLVTGQHPEVSDRYCGAVYIVVSSDGGKNWTKRGTVAMDSEGVPYGYSGDGNEVTMAFTTDGKLIVAMRMDVSVSPKGNSEFCEAYVAISEDLGYTWTKPFPVAEASVTPQMVALDDNLLIFFYGRPGVHFKISEDGGKTWSEDYRVIGKNYTEARALGIPDSKSKYGDMESYSNVFVEKLSGDSVFVCFNDMKYDEGDGELHRAAFVQKITVKKEMI